MRLTYQGDGAAMEAVASQLVAVLADSRDYSLSRGSNASRRPLPTRYIVSEVM